MITKKTLGCTASRRVTSHKMTQLGLIPDDWDARLGDLVVLKTGPFGSLIHKSDYVRDGVPLINPIHMSDGRILPDASTTVTRDAADRLIEFRLRKGDVVVARRGEMGRSAVVLAEQDGWVCGTGSMILRPRDELDPTFLQRVFSSPAIVSRITNASVGSTMVSLNNSTLSGLLVQLPRYREQRAIAGALSDVDELIGALDAVVAKKRAIKLAAMQQLLTGKTRLPGFEGKWEETTLGELATFLSGGTPSRSNDDYWAGEIPWISATSLRCFEIWRSDRNVTEEAVAAGSRMAPVGSTLLLVRGSALHKEILCGLVTKPVCFNQDVKALVPHSQVVPIFLTTVINGRAEDLLRLVSSAGNTAGVLDTKLLKAFEIQLPNPDEQAAIADVLSDMDAEITALEKRRDKTKGIKQGMMQSLLTGRVRLVES